MRMAMMVTHTSRTDVMSAVPNVTRTRYSPAATSFATVGCARSHHERARIVAWKSRGSAYTMSPSFDTCATLRLMLRMNLS